VDGEGVKILSQKFPLGHPVLFVFYHRQLSIIINTTVVVELNDTFKGKAITV
jgi:hypothetical protein